MDKFLTYEGGQPVWLDDLKFIEKSVKDTFIRAIAAFAQYPYINCILQGCEVTETEDYVNWTSGVIMFDGEILGIDAGRIPIQSGQTYSFAIIESYDPFGERTFRDGQSHNCYQIRTATIAYNGDRAHSVDGTPVLREEMDNLYHLEKKFVVYKSPSSDDYQTKAEIIVSGGGLYLSGTLEALPKLDEDAKFIIPETQIDTSLLHGVSWPVGHRRAVLYYKAFDVKYEQYLAVTVYTQIISGKPSIRMEIPTDRQLTRGDTSFFIRLN